MQLHVYDKIVVHKLMGISSVNTRLRILFVVNSDWDLSDLLFVAGVVISEILHTHSHSQLLDPQV